MIGNTGKKENLITWAFSKGTKPALNARTNSTFIKKSLFITLLFHKILLLLNIFFSVSLESGHVMPMLSGDYRLQLG